MALDQTLAVAPMMDWTDRHCRYFHRFLSRRAVLYTEMVTTGALLHADRARFLAFDPFEHPLVLQLGGADPGELAACARMAAEWGYDHVNLNVGCPSERVQTGRFGACLMAEPDLVARGVEAMLRASPLPVTVKTRIGIDDVDPEPFLFRFVDRVAAAGCRTFIIHARKAWLQGLSPKENRDIPPLDYGLVHRLKAARPELEIIINGGIRTPEVAMTHLKGVDGVMIGREAYQNPASLAVFERTLFAEGGDGGGGGTVDRLRVVAAMARYLEREEQAGTPTRAVTRHMLGLFNGLPGARRWRRTLSTSTLGGHELLAAALPPPRDGETVEPLRWAS